MAAASLEAMPPLPKGLPGPPARRSSSWSISTTSSMSDASASCRGSAVSRPGVSVSSTSTSARTRWATSAASRSLSPKRISSSATASFSLTTGTTPSSTRWRSVPRAWRYWVRCTKSSGARSTCPATRECGSSPSCHRRMRRCWPTAETAWRTAGSPGRCSPRPSAAQPAAMAPELTTTMVCPARRAAASSPQSRATVGAVAEVEPSLTTAITPRPPRCRPPTRTSSTPPSPRPRRARPRGPGRGRPPGGAGGGPPRPARRRR